MTKPTHTETNPNDTLHKHNLILVTMTALQMFFDMNSATS